MPRNKLVVGMLALLVTIVMAACSSSHDVQPTLTGSQLSTRIIPAPTGYTGDPTPNASGQITPAVFASYGGVKSPSKLGFVAGFRQNYVDTSSGEGVSVTLLEFSSPGRARSYLAETAHQTLSYAAATYKPFTQVPGATEADGTKAYAGEYSHGVVAAINDYYYQLVYVNAKPASVPFEFYTWAKVEWALLKTNTSASSLAPTTSTSPTTSSSPTASTSPTTS